MEARQKYGFIIAALTILVLALRLTISFQVAEPGYESYFALVQAASIRETGLPRFHDPYSYQGRTYAFSPLFSYLVALFTLFLPATFVVKLLPNLFMALLVPLAYLVAHAMTKNRPLSLAGALFAGFSPALFRTGINEAVPLTLALPLLAATLLALLELQKRPRLALLLTFILTLASPIVWLLFIAEVLYLLLLRTEALPVSDAYFEIGIITFLLAGWYTLFAYKEALYRYGVAVLKASLPVAVRQATFQSFTTLAMLYAVGVVPIMLGSLSLYHAAFEQRNRKVYLVASLILTLLVALLFQMLPLKLGLTLLSLAFVLLSPYGLQVIVLYFKKTRVARGGKLVTVLFLTLFLLTSILPALTGGVYPQSSPTREEIAAASWLGNQTTGVIAAAPKTGFLLNLLAKQKYLADTAYLLAPHPERVLNDLDSLYTTPSTVAATALAEQYGVTHIFLGPAENARYQELGAILQDQKCFPRVYQSPRVLILQVNCTLITGVAR